MCPSWRVWSEPVSRCSPGDFGACGGALPAGCKGSGAAAGRGGRVSGPSPELPPPPAGPFLPSPPCGVALWPHFQWFPGSGTDVFANFAGKGGGMPLSRERTVPASLQGRARAWKWRSIRGSHGGCKYMDPHLRTSGGPRAPLADPHSEALATSQNGWKEDEGDCRRGGKGKMLVPSAPFLLSRRRDSLPGLRLGPACAGRVGGERGSSVPRGILPTTCSDGVHSAASYPWAGAVIPSWGWGRTGQN